MDGLRLGSSHRGFVIGLKPQLTVRHGKCLAVREGSKGTRKVTSQGVDQFSTSQTRCVGAKADGG